MDLSVFERRSGHDRQRGAFTIPAVASMFILMLSFVVVSQFAVWLYAKGALQAATQAAARSAAPLGAAPGSCEQAFERSRQQLLGGEVGRGVGVVRCVVDDDLVTVGVDAYLASWLPITPGWEVTVSAVAVREVEPT